ncbi:hypothetical protein TNCV_1798291 [Trichonephila clavipes]|uniref:Uncharacterized protein n=1 Tax=Trichonephila clavipes TaxID=2585209 RepID=A0A8X6SEI9_TRICX|nr:hypothetical protein TNCV_1798291 [Trichonephila clavipes]
MSEDKFNKKKSRKRPKRCTTSVDDRSLKIPCFRDKIILWTSIRSDLSNAGVSASSKTARSRLTDTQRGTTFGSSKLASAVAGNGHYGHPALSGKITGISNIRFRILVHHLEND